MALEGGPETGNNPRIRPISGLLSKGLKNLKERYKQSIPAILPLTRPQGSRRQALISHLLSAFSYVEPSNSD
jgi:hypothetical protein